MNRKPKTYKTMRTFLLFVLGVLMMTACGPNRESQVETTDEGKTLMEASDCRSCHSINSGIIGPAYMDVAKKYETTEASVEMLAERIIKGGSGVWGEIPMNPHTDISKDDAKKMARYVLSLDEGDQK
jgi:cytochrome c